MTKAERTRQFIIEQSAPVFNTKGIAGTAMSDIMEATKMAKGGLYGHFESKEELSYAVVDYSLDLLSKKVTTALNKYQTAKEKLFAYMDFFNQPECAIKGGCPMLNFGMEADSTNPVINKKIKQNIIKSQQFIAGIIKEGVENQEFKPDLDADGFAVKLFALMEGGTMITNVIGDNSQMNNIIKMLRAEIEAQLT
jgi:TetR/AcrR family transcriptional repressor of nem operon